MRIVWANFAIENLGSIFEYYNEVAGFKIATGIRDGLINESVRLLDNPESGQIELSVQSSEEYRYLLKDNYKLIYKINGNDIIITDVFDTRQNPKGIIVRPEKPKSDNMTFNNFI